MARIAPTKSIVFFKLVVFEQNALNSFNSNFVFQPYERSPVTKFSS